ncbi:hypothetical protein OG730_08710 [Streptomyces sp. NBC_01298]|uniref:hypothetical protein n=1 Tax=Streptomyces sp. NBC_01298 TaxID=2903817 RepID=UPI002E0E45CA|nr:hypothetical protein OG730_08710 [Streptomyces sp. NBC_01298]
MTVAMDAREEQWPGWERYWCPVCDTLVYKGFATGYRSDRLYCSGKCRSRAYRQRHRAYASVT